jgi:hypothetical protein
MPAVVRGITFGASATTAVPIPAATQDGDTLLMITFRNTAANTGVPVPAFDFGAHYVSTNTPGCRVARTIWNTGDATSYSSTNSNLGYCFIAFVGAVTIGTVISNIGTIGAMNIPAVTLVDADGSSRVFYVGVHRDASAIPTTPDGMTEEANWQPASAARAQMASTGGVTEWNGDASHPVTDGSGVSGWRTLAFEVQGADEATPPGSGSGSGTLTYTGTAVGKREPVGSGSGTVAYAGSAVGKRQPVGSGSGTRTYSGTAVGKRSPVGSATGTLTYAGAAIGFAPEFNNATGSGSGTLTYTGTAVGKRRPIGVGAGTLTYIGSAVGKRRPVGVGGGTLTYEGSASGFAPDVLEGEYVAGPAHAARYGSGEPRAPRYTSGGAA